MQTVQLTRRVPAGTAVASLCLPFELRQRSRLRVVLSDGREAAVVLPRGGVLRGGDLIADAEGSVVLVEAAPEDVSTAFCAQPTLLARACYHLGNRHVPVQVGTGWVRYQRDHVLDEMVLRLGLGVVHECAPFEPEAGAYRHSHDGPAHAAGI